MTRRRPRKPSAEERDLWLRVAASTTALHPARSAAADDNDPPKPPPQPAPPQKSRSDFARFHIGQSARAAALRVDLAPSPAERLAQAPIRMDRKAHQKMTRGKLDPEARIDLHGMTLAEAHPELIRFLLNAHTAGRRLVLVITGKGKRGHDEGPIPQRQGVLRHQVPHWLHQPPLGQVVLQVSQAHLKHGGAGAYYVYLRRGG